MAENTLPITKSIVLIKEGLESLYRHDLEVFVAGDLLWYPVEGDSTIRVAPDIMVIFGRPKGYRGSYMQWRENNIAPQTVFEILSPGNRPQEMLHKFSFFQEHGVEEVYLYDPDTGRSDRSAAAQEGLEAIAEHRRPRQPAAGDPLRAGRGSRSSQDPSTRAGGPFVTPPRS